MNERTEILFDLRNRILSTFEKSDWIDLGIMTSCSDIIEKDQRLLRSLSWNDDDYPERVRVVLSKMLARDVKNQGKIEKYIVDKELDPHSSSNRSEFEKVVYSNLKNSELFKIPDKSHNKKQVALMMPFDSSLKSVNERIKLTCNKLDLICLRVDDIWSNETIIQDIFDLIYCSEILIADFTGKNPNVFYEVGIAHTLGKKVIPITQSLDDVPFDLRHHRILKYLPNNEGLINMGNELETRIKTLINK